MPNIMSKSDYYVLPDSTCGEIMRNAFQIKKGKVIYSASPRLISTNKKFTNDKMKIIYMPTFRDGGNVIENDWSDLDLELKKRRLMFDVKLHPFDNVLGDELKNLQSFNILAVDDVYEELPKYDLLISDYSSVFIDALYLNIPTILHAYDLESYTLKSRELYLDFGLIAKKMNVSKTTQELLSLIDNGVFDCDYSLYDYFWGKHNNKYDVCCFIHRKLRDL